MMDFAISDVKMSGSTARELVSFGQKLMSHEACTRL